MSSVYEVIEVLEVMRCMLPYAGGDATCAALYAGGRGG